MILDYEVSNTNKQTLDTARHRRSRAGASSLRNTVTLIVLDQQDVKNAPNGSDMTLGALKYLSIKPRFVADRQEVE